MQFTVSVGAVALEMKEDYVCVIKSREGGVLGRTREGKRRQPSYDSVKKMENRNATSTVEAEHRIYAANIYHVTYSNESADYLPRSQIHDYAITSVYQLTVHFQRPKNSFKRLADRKIFFYSINYTN